jgi:hypothetical protein
MNRADLAIRWTPAVWLALASACFGSKIDVWKQESAAAFAKAKKDRVVVSDAGRARLGRAVSPTEGIDAAQVWDLARSKDVVYAATGNSGKVFKREGRGRWTLAFDAEDSQALSLATLSDGRVFAGTGPTGQVIDISDPKHPASRPDKEVLYIWDLAADGSGNLYAATGPTGQLWKRSSEGAWSLLLDSKHPHLLCVAVADDGSVYAGSDGEGLIYRVSADGKVSVVYDASQTEIRALAIGPDGSVFAGTAAEAGGGSGATPRGFSSPTSFESAPPTLPETSPTEAAAKAPLVQNRTRGGEPAPAGGTAAPRPPAPGENAVYHIGADGAVREIFRTRALMFSLAWNNDRLLVGTGPEGLLYEIRGLGREVSPIARIDHAQILSLLIEADGELLLGAGDPGGVLRLSRDHFAAGSITSEVHDAKLVSRFGAVSWKVDAPQGTSVSLQVRSGNVGDPDGTWSPWSPPRTNAGGSQSGVPAGRFVQYRASLQTDDPARTPELHAVTLLSQTVNLPPELTKIDVPDLSAGDGATKQAKLNLRWDATDPNGDELLYTLLLHKDGWPDWVRLSDSPLSEKTYAWDASSVPGGTYRLRVSASDRPSNRAEDALSRELTSEPFIIDHEAPAVALAVKSTTVTVTLNDSLTRLARAAYALDGGDWVSVFPVDGLFDSSSETISIALSDLKPGTHILMVRATDAAGNVGAGDVVVKAP